MRSAEAALLLVGGSRETESPVRVVAPRKGNLSSLAKTRNNGRYNGNGRHWATPWELYRQLDEEFHFTLDPCATEETAKCDIYYTEVENGLIQDWSGERVFMNPPYGKEIYEWTRKARLEARKGALVVGLLPGSIDLAWWHDDVVNHAEVRYIRGRVRFLTDRAGKRASGFFSSVIVIWHPKPPGPRPRMRLVKTYVGGA